MNATEKEIVEKVLAILPSLKMRVHEDENAKKQLKEVEYLLLLLK